MSALPDTVVIAPHCDDAAFSLGAAITAGLLGKVSVITLFSRTNFMLREPGDIDAVTRLRKAEETAALSSRAQRLVFHDLDDWCLGTRAQAALTPAQAQGAGEAIERLAREASAGVLLFPLGIGKHPDHLAARALAARFGEGWRVGFYEDLPYAATALRTGMQFAPAGMGPQVCAGDLRAKLAMLAHYRSQIEPRAAQAISQYHRLIGGERIFWRGASPS